ncbi:hypothetical protein IJ182_00545 [bacterium]|nr:hypothetical protein [bacterium]
MYVNNSITANVQGNSNAAPQKSAKELKQELKAAKKYEKESKILSIYGADSNGKRSAGKIIASTLLIGLVPTIHYAKKADKIAMQREIDDLKGQLENKPQTEQKSVKELKQEYKAAKKYEKETKILDFYGKNPETGKRSAGKILASYFCLGLIPTAAMAAKADNIAMKRELEDLRTQVEEKNVAEEAAENENVVDEEKAEVNE